MPGGQVGSNDRLQRREVPAYFLSADIVAPSGERVSPLHGSPRNITNPLIYSGLAPSQKYSSWRRAGDASTAGITMETPGAKESVACVLNGAQPPLRQASLQAHNALNSFAGNCHPQQLTPPASRFPAPAN